MALKLSTSSAAALKAVVECSEESLRESIDQVTAASEALFEAQADGVELCQVIDNLALTAEALANGGLSAEFLKTFNSAGETMAAAGCEALTVHGLEALAEDQVKKLQAKVAAGIEGKAAEYWNKFIAFLKNLWSKIVNWFKALFVNRAKWVKMLESMPVTVEGFKTNADKKITVLGSADVEEMISLAKKIAGEVKTFAGKISSGADIPTSFAKFDEEAEKLTSKTATEGTLKSLWDSAAKIDSVQGKFMFEAKSPDIVNASKVIDGAFKSLIAEAGKAANAPVNEGQAALKETVNKKRDALNAAIKACRVEARLLMKAGSILVTVKKAAAAKK